MTATTTAKDTQQDLLDRYLRTERDRLNEIDSANSEYRKSGLALMSTIIGLSTAILVAGDKWTLEKGEGFVFLLPIILAIVQELAHYLGQAADAQHRWVTHLFFLSIALDKENPNTRAWIQNGRLAIWRRGCFCVADFICVCTVVSFICLVLDLVW